MVLSFLILCFQMKKQVLNLSFLAKTKKRQTRRNFTKKYFFQDSLQSKINQKTNIVVSEKVTLEGTKHQQTALKSDPANLLTKPLSLVFLGYSRLRKNVGLTFINFGFFSMPYSLFKGPTLITILKCFP